MGPGIGSDTVNIESLLTNYENFVGLLSPQLHGNICCIGRCFDFAHTGHENPSVVHFRCEDVELCVAVLNREQFHLPAVGGYSASASERDS